MNTDPRPGRPRLLVIGPLPPPVHGASLVTERLAARLRDHMSVVTCDISPGAAAGGLAYHATRLRRVLGAAMAVLAASRDTRVYLSAAGGSGLIYTALLAALARFTGRPLIVHHHSFAYINRRSRLMALVAAVAGRGAWHLALCPRMAAGLTALYPGAARTATLSNAFLFSPEGLPARTDVAAPLRLGHLSNLSREKGLIDVLALQAALQGAGTPCELRLAGAAADPADAAAVAAAVAASAGAIRHLGPLYDAAKTEFFASIDAFLFPSRYVNEAEPLVVFEALSQGVPVFAYDRGCIAEQLGDTGGLIVAADASFADAAGARLAEWTADRGRLHAAQAAAAERMATLSAEASRQFAAFLSILGVAPDAAQMGQPT